MTLYDYRASDRLAAEDVPFYALVMAAMRKADTDNLEMLRRAWPETWNELQARYNAPGGLLPDEIAEQDDVGGTNAGRGGRRENRNRR